MPEVAVVIVPDTVNSAAVEVVAAPMERYQSYL